MPGYSKDVFTLLSMVEGDNYDSVAEGLQSFNFILRRVPRRGSVVCAMHKDWPGSVAQVNRVVVECRA